MTLGARSFLLHGDLAGWSPPPVRGHHFDTEHGRFDNREHLSHPHSAIVNTVPRVILPWPAGCLRLVRVVRGCGNKSTRLCPGNGGHDCVHLGHRICLTQHLTMPCTRCLMQLQKALWTSASSDWSPNVPVWEEAASEGHDDDGVVGMARDSLQWHASKVLVLSNRPAPGPARCEHGAVL